MARKTAHKHVRHVPQRTCVGCRKTLAKRSLIRLVHTEDGIMIDSSGKLPGRGAYLHNVRTCWETGLKGSLAHALKLELSEADRVKLREFSTSLSENSSEAE